MKHHSLAWEPVDEPDSIVSSQDQLRQGEDASGQGVLESCAARKIQQSIAYMVQHLNQPLQVAKLAQTSHFSPSHFFVLFKRCTGHSPIDYFIRLRMERAARLLSATELNVKEIAAALGYDDPFYFSRVFKAIHGIAPRDYRLKIGQTESAESLEQSS
jgi:AraC-like DNA-binding protein